MFEPRYVILCNTARIRVGRVQRRHAQLLTTGKNDKFKVRPANLLYFFKSSMSRCRIRETLRKFVPEQSYEDSWGVWRNHNVYRVRFFIFIEHDATVELEMFDDPLVRAIAKLVEL